MFAGNRSTVAYSAFGTGELDIESLTTAFLALLARYPVLAAQIIPNDNGFALLHTPHPPALRVGTCLALPEAGFAVVDEVCAVDIAQQRNDFRLTLLTHHSVADAAASLRYLEELCALYTRVVQTGSPGTIVAHPLAVSLEQFLTDRGFVIPRSDDTEPPGPAADTSAAVVVRHGRTRLDREETARLFDFARAAGLTVHGIVCAAILLAAHDLSRSDGPVSFSAVSSVDLRTRAGQPLAVAAGTVIQGSDTATIAVRSGDDPVRIGRAVLDSLADGLSRRTVHHAFLRPRDIWRKPAANQMLVTNWGRIPALRLPEGVRLHDFRASASGVRSGRATAAPPSFFVTTCDGRLSLDHPVWAADGSDPTVAWTRALRRAFDRICG
ncbi:acyltransferase [Mycobacterium sp. CBMA271]|uniref:phthiocerol/phthiodiolone dimycocerosyl transferase family protein n=1 Tax=unclassified Mycobacteroides TaxID=2618759 RepID=UPI0012DF4EB9|nr:MULTISPECIES: acyltransferase [unclassified Mycobacteroides]MUM17089.1 acyltransferase [Mycobacteroides sp. CBMA 326]MUM23327.1 acyltransferase [Mycobacteroides sp. CBMA 271]